MTIQTLLKNSSQILKKSSSTPIIDSEVFLCEAIKKSKEFILANPNFEITKSQEKKFWEMVERRKKCEPVAYIINKKEFFGLEFYVDKNVLIPRPETEIMVEMVLEIIRNHYLNNDLNQYLDIIDAGTGSGCIIGAIAKKSPLLPFTKGENIKNINFFALDSNSDSLKIARKNFRKLNLKNIKTLQGDLSEPYLEKSLCPLSKRGKIIMANLPYLNAEEYKNTPCDVKKYEPKSALYGGLDGMKYINKLLKQIKIARLENYILILEISPSQAEYFNSEFKIIKDLFEKDRFAIKSEIGNWKSF